VEASPPGTRERLLDAAIDLARRQGMSGAGINEIVRASGAPKGSVYWFFPEGKQQIVSEALDMYAGRVVAFIDAAMSGKRSAKARIEALFDAFGRRVEEARFLQSCPAGTVCLDLGEQDDALRAAVAASFERYAEAIAAHLLFARSGRAASFARLALTAIEGAYIRSRAIRSRAPFIEAGTWLGELAAREPVRAHRA
jgi:TetR/AcrR family transcriptional repressor of lmrAB and yxaGH operons